MEKWISLNFLTRRQYWLLLLIVNDNEEKNGKFIAIPLDETRKRILLAFCVTDVNFQIKNNFSEETNSNFVYLPSINQRREELKFEMSLNKINTLTEEEEMISY